MWETDLVNKFIYGDDLEVMGRLPDRSIHLVLTDIPYDVVNRKSGGLRNLDRGVADKLAFELSDFMDQVVRVALGSIYIFCGTEQVSYIRSRMVEAGLSTRLGIWEKSNPSPMNGERIWLSGIEVCVYGKRGGATFNEHCKTPVWTAPVVHHSKRIHPTEKPLLLGQYLIHVSSKEGDIVLDPCMGGGTFPLGARMMGRRFIGVDSNADYVVKARIRNNRYKDIVSYNMDNSDLMWAVLSIGRKRRHCAF